MKDWYSGRYQDPLDRLSEDELRTMYADCKEAHVVISRRWEEAQKVGHQIRVFALLQERKRLAGIGADIRRRLPVWTHFRRISDAFKTH